MSTRINKTTKLNLVKKIQEEKRECLKLIPYVYKSCGVRREGFYLPQDSSILYPDNILVDVPQKRQHGDAKKRGSRKLSQDYRVLNFLGGSLKSIHSILNDMDAADS